MTLCLSSSSALQWVLRAKVHSTRFTNCPQRQHAKHDGGYPTEFFMLISVEVAFPTLRFDANGTLGQPNADLKASTLCSKTCAAQTPPFHFYNLMVFVSAESLAKMTAIAKYPHYQYGVKEVRVFPRFFAAIGSLFDEAIVYHDCIDWLKLRGANVDTDSQDLNELQWPVKPTGSPTRDARTCAHSNQISYSKCKHYKRTRWGSSRR